MLVAGEASGDLHAASLVKELKYLDGSLTFSGLGGPKMRAQGVELYQDLTQIAVVGFWEVLKHYADFKKSFHLILDKIRRSKPLAVILVDYPGFNLRLAREIKKLNIKVIYYISPQVWAWKENRVKLIKQYVDHMLVLFNFEKEFYARHGIRVECVGHPLLDALTIHTPKEKFLNTLGLNSDSLTLGLLPGSRLQEIERHLPIMLQASSLLSQEFPNLQFLLIQAPGIDHSFFEKFIKNSSLKLRLVKEEGCDGLNACDVCMVASGTATLEAALLEKPMVVMYKTSLLTYVLAKSFVKIPDVGLVNVVAGKRIVPECLQHEANSRNIAKKIKEIIGDEIKIASLKAELRKVKKNLGERGASQRAAITILKLLNLNI